MRICVRLLALLLALMPVWGSAEGGAYEEKDVLIHDGLPPITIRVTDTGERHEEADRPNVLLVHAEAQDGSLSQEFTFQSNELPGGERAAALVFMDDVNFDGYQDMVLLTAMGARNVFHAVSLWNKEEGRFNPAMQGVVWDTENQCLSQESRQLDLCNYVLIPERRAIQSSIADGYAYWTETVYAWEGEYGLSIESVADVYDAGEALIGETVLLFGTEITRCWDESYPEKWYYGQEGEGARGERLSSIREVTLGRAAQEPELMEVANVDWVNLRKQDSKASPSLAKLTAGTTVVKLADGIGPDKGWVRVWLRETDGGDKGLTGYIWHSFLEPCEP